MKLFVQSSMIIAIAAMFNVFLLADITPSMPPADSWEQCPGGIALAMTFITQKEIKNEKSTLTIYLKNTSDNVKEFNADFIANNLEIYDLKGNHTWVPLRTVDPLSITRLSMSSIKPKQAVALPIDLLPEEVKIIKSHTIRFHVQLSDAKNNEPLNIASLPTKITETIVSAHQ